jgi:hypothetical protein
MAAASRSRGLAARMESGEAWHMDVRVKTFVRQAADRLGFLRTEFGFTAPEVVPHETGVYPLLRRLRFERADLAIEVSLVLSYMGEEYVALDLVTADDSGSIHRTEIGSGTAHTGYQMRRALDLQAKAVRKVLSAEMPPSPS